MNPANFILKTVDKLEDEFEKVLEKGFDQDSKFYYYLNDIRVAAKKLK